MKSKKLNSASRVKSGIPATLGDFPGRGGGGGGGAPPGGGGGGGDPKPGVRE